MEIYSRLQWNNGDKLIKIFGLKIYEKSQNQFITKKKYFYSIFKYVLQNISDEKYYIFGIRIFKRCNLKKFIHYSQTELINLRNKNNTLIKTVNNIYNNMYILQQVPYIHKNFIPYKNCNIGKEIVILAGGPTFKYYNNALCNSNIIKCGINGIIALVDDLDYLITEDYFVDDENLNNKIDNYKGNNCKKFYGILPHKRLQDVNKNRIFTERIKPHNIYNADAIQFLISDVFCDRWAINIDTEAIGDFGGAVFSALQILLYTHPSKIYLVGCDCSNADLAYENNRKNICNHESKIEKFKLFKKFADRIYPDIEIISINPIGLKGIFKDIYTKEYLINCEINNENMEILI